MKTSGLVILLTGFLFVGCKKSETKEGTATNTSSGNPLTAPVDYLGAVSKAQKTASKVVDNVGLKQAIGQFYAVEGRFPKDLNELVTEKYVDKLPPPPRGMKFVYNPTTGDLKIE